MSDSHDHGYPLAHATANHTAVGFVTVRSLRWTSRPTLSLHPRKSPANRERNGCPWRCIWGIIDRTNNERCGYAKKLDARSCGRGRVRRNRRARRPARRPRRSAQATISRLQDEGYTVNIDRIGSAPMSECVVTNVRNPKPVSSGCPTSAPAATGHDRALVLADRQPVHFGHAGLQRATQTSRRRRRPGRVRYRPGLLMCAPYAGAGTPLLAGSSARGAWSSSTIVSSSNGSSPRSTRRPGPCRWSWSTTDQHRGHGVAGEVRDRARLGHEPVDADDQADAVEQVGPVALQAARQRGQAGAGHTRRALGGDDHEHQQADLLGDRHRAAQRVGDEQRRHRQVDRGAVQVERVAGRDDDADGAAVDTQVLHLGDQPRQRGLRRRGREDQQVLAGEVAHQLEDRTPDTTRSSVPSTPNTNSMQVM